MAGTISAEQAERFEGGYITFTVRLSQVPASPVRVDYRLIDRTADVGTDVFPSTNGNPLAGTLTFFANQQVKTLRFFVGDDGLDEIDESFLLQLSNSVRAQFAPGVPALRVIGWALDNDGVGLNRALTVSSPTIVDGPAAAAVFEVSLSRPSATPVTVNYRTVAGTAGAADFVPKIGQVTFQPGQTTAQVLVPIIADVDIENPESFQLQLLPPFPSTIANTGIVVGTATIFDYAVRGTLRSDSLAGSAFAERIEGLDGNDTIRAGGGNDALFGGAGNDSLDGMAGSDLMVGKTGNDVYVVDSALDRIVEDAGLANGIDQLNAFVSYVMPANVERLQLFGAAPLTGIGNALGNVMVGNEAANTLDGLDGNDVLYGKFGDDTLRGGDGNDFILGGPGNDVMAGGIGNDRYIVQDVGDRVFEPSGRANGVDLITSAISITLPVNVERLALGTVAPLNGVGNELDNVMFGNASANGMNGLAGNDYIDAGAGNDRIGGAVGNDILVGGTGFDTLLYFTGRDNVRGFQNNIDTLLFDDVLWGGGPRTAAQILSYAEVVGPNTLFDFGGGRTLLVEGVTNPNRLIDDVGFY